MEEKLSTKYYLGIDWGKSKIGLAVADSELLIAKALKEIKADGFENEIDILNQEYAFDLVVIGIVDVPDKYGSKNKDAVAALSALLRSKGYQVELESELFSTKMAQQNLASQGIKAVSKKDNAESARLILQSYLDRKYRDYYRPG